MNLSVATAPALTPARAARYDERTDAVVYGSSVTASFTRADWLALAIAALDQAGVSARVQNDIRSLVFDDGDES